MLAILTATLDGGDKTLGPVLIGNHKSVSAKAVLANTDAVGSLTVQTSTDGGDTWDDAAWVKKDGSVIDTWDVSAPAGDPEIVGQGFGDGAFTEMLLQFVWTHGAGSSANNALTITVFDK
jgi:hypothetical protein